MQPAGVLILIIVVVVAALALAVTLVVVVAGIKREEHEFSMTRKTAPGSAAWLTRQIVGLYVRKTDPEPACDCDPEPPARRRERSR